MDPEAPPRVVLGSEVGPPRAPYLAACRFLHAGLNSSLPCSRLAVLCGLAQASRGWLLGLMYLSLGLKTTHSEGVRLHTIWLFTLLGGWTGWAFGVATVGGLGTAVMLRSQYRTHGYLMMATILFALLIPVQAYVAWQDYTLWTLFDRTSGMPLAQPAEILRVFLYRYTTTAVNVMIGMSMLAALTILLVITLRPLVQSSVSNARS